MKDISVVVKYELEDEKGNVRPCRLQKHGDYESELEAMKDFIDWLSETDADWQVKYQTKKGKNFAVQTFELKKDEDDNTSK